MFFKIFVARRDRLGIILEFNLGVGSHVSITFDANFAAGEGCKPLIIQSALLDYIVVCYILVCKVSG